MTPKNFIWLFLTFIWFEGGYLKKILLKNSHSQKLSFMTSVLFGFTQDFIFGLGGFSILCWLITNVFHLGKILKIFLSSPMAFGVIFSPLKNSSCHDMSGNPLPKAISHLCVKIYFKSSKLNLPMNFLAINSYQKYFLPSTLALGDLQRSYHFYFELGHQTNFPG